jgi:hypothetical protein
MKTHIEEETHNSADAIEMQNENGVDSEMQKLQQQQ